MGATAARETGIWSGLSDLQHCCVLATSRLPTLIQKPTQPLLSLSVAACMKDTSALSTGHRCLLHGTFEMPVRSTATKFKSVAPILYLWAQAPCHPASSLSQCAQCLHDKRRCSRHQPAQSIGAFKSMVMSGKSCAGCSAHLVAAGALANAEPDPSWRDHLQED